MSTEFKVVVEGELSEGTTEAVTAAIQKAVLLELAGSRDLEAGPDSGEADAPSLIFRPRIYGGIWIVGSRAETNA
jgi:hypothetical protein